MTEEPVFYVYSNRNDYTSKHKMSSHPQEVLRRMACGQSFGIECDFNSSEELDRPGCKLYETL